MRHLLCVLALLAHLTAAPALAQTRWYAGLSLGVENFDADYTKDVAVPQSAPAEVLARAQGGNLTRSSGDRAGEGVGVLVGRRQPFVRGALYWSAEADVHWSDARASGRNPGTGAGRQRGENWAEDWDFEREVSYGLTLRVGKPLSDATSVYLLAGARGTRVRFHADYTGCAARSCDAEDFFEDTLGHAENLFSWRAGAGLEKRLGDNTALRAELHYTGDDKDEALDVFHFEDGGPNGDENYDILVPYSAESSAFGLALSVVRYF